MSTGWSSWTVLGALTAAVCAGPAAFAKSTTVGPFCSSGEAWLVRSDAEEIGDKYIVAGGGISMDGRHIGDLFGWAPTISIDGEVQGDLFAGANSITISGTIRDSTRLFGQTIDIDGTIEGDLLIFAAALTLKENAHITGDVFGSTAHFTHIGRVDGNIRLTTGESTIAGFVGEDLELTADTIHLREGARIEGDLTYASRTELPDGASSFVSGETIHKKVADEDETEGRGFTFGTLVRWLYWPFAAFIVGAVLLALGGRHGHVPTRRMNEEGWTGLAVGMLALPVLGVASVVALVLVLTIPLGVLGLFLLAVLAYVGKIPTAIWLGSRILALRGPAEPSPYLSLALGLVLAYLVFSIPFYIGIIAWWVATSAGIGALILAVMALRKNTEKSPAQA